jgi:hypothetical protein
MAGAACAVEASTARAASAMVVYFIRTSSWLNFGSSLVGMQILVPQMAHDNLALWACQCGSLISGKPY